ncbi:MalY/PatB family protein [Thiosulfativibrio zosterae]|uniref:cysteine-S-conjugate beta-lyase n=1 Tax=Thiosulfativibrio zosterae TaxID=2675053 RepID=A0A6F8PQP1_9GAMM|nr:PatB family C-S lyase [Thiosulfativibrio zosterae]BBP44443.1 aminotransferase [Thiosulfativibrio zosterae]
MPSPAVIFDFDRVWDRSGTDAEKYDARQAVFGTTDVIPLWVADMDFATPDFIIEALKNRLEHPLLGYTLMSEALYQAVIDWQAQQDYHLEASQICWTHNVANGFHLAVQAFTQVGDAILVQPPIYPPFLKAPELNDRRCIESPLVLEKGQYHIDFAAFESQIQRHHIKLFLFSHPQNPSGRVWQPDELLKLGQICIKHQVIIVSDEIHSDLVYPPFKHVPLASLSPDIAQNTVTLSSPGKTFNLGGLQIGYAIIANPVLKKAFERVSQRLKIQDLNVMGAVALQAAYSDLGREYKKQLVTYLNNNIQTVLDFFAEQAPQVKVMRPQATYLIWIDFSALFNAQEDLQAWLIFKAKLGLGSGINFGEAGRGFMRMNIALPKSQLQQALSQLKSALHTL